MSWFKQLFGKKEVLQTPLFFFNTLGKEKQLFEAAPHTKEVRMYNCGPTVYGRQHIGNLSMFVFTDTLRHTLEYNDFKVKQVINFTDFGHLSSDADEGEDKMTKGLKREGLAPTLDNMRALGEKYANLFLEDIRALNIEVDKVTFPRASDFIPAQIAMIKALEEKGYAYKTKRGVYFDTSRFPDYGKLGNINLEGQKEGARIGKDPEKRNPIDFLLWKNDKKLGWDSPWGKGFPGWHIECSAMIRATLGLQIDIHTGGIEHIPVHHNNEIAQSESATGKKPLARFWLHRAHLQLEGAKIAKSEGNVVYLSDIIERGFHPLSLRYLLLSAHYRTSANFTWEALGAAQTAYAKLLAMRLKSQKVSPPGFSQTTLAWKQKFTERINDDLDTPGALAVLWEMTKDEELPSEELLAALLDFDSVLGLNLSEPDEAARRLAATETKKEITLDSLPEDIRTLIKEREEARENKDWPRADELRTKIENLGYALEDSASGTRVFEP
ncbi:cysteine--tRNA ligase [Candidatus Kaiserbacteria bacterium RIFCSPLOWO2_12_FULL_53_8]|uniref:Cysteine--tRNA ligase n=2 Tax=Candidatus Kaiseribacteriota TaxID=1752734 RepID=A0A1F6CXZ1_9BACT|nr:MAG: cysteine--tRNA ligase [Candidatus Kaiserbacteria bacterium RIFCSPHIGHO2_01_FULL_53_29]OGG91108.1 MAG: cysteine--tRNA ligase [Candidatus Kaiserbacteria bacterium RIFCSPLOWO2_12_FULL_53_8]